MRSQPGRSKFTLLLEYYERPRMPQNVRNSKNRLHCGWPMPPYARLFLVITSEREILPMNRRKSLPIAVILMY